MGLFDIIRRAEGEQGNDYNRGVMNQPKGDGGIPNSTLNRFKYFTGAKGGRE